MQGRSESEVIPFSGLFGDSVLVLSTRLSGLFVKYIMEKKGFSYYVIDCFSYPYFGFEYNVTHAFQVRDKAVDNILDIYQALINTNSFSDVVVDDLGHLRLLSEKYANKEDVVGAIKSMTIREHLHFLP